MSSINTESFTLPAGARPLIERLAEEPFALEFSGQGYAWLPTLRAQTAAHATVAGYVTQAAAVLEPLADELAPFFPHGFDPLTWARESAPGDPTDAAVSTPGILVTQIAVLEQLAAQGLDISRAVARLGHSQGTLATFVADGSMKPEHAIALAQLIGAALTRTARAEGLLRTAENAPMLSVQGATREQLEAAGATIGLRNGHKNFVIVGADNTAVRARLEKAAARSAKAHENKERGGAAFAPKFT